MKGLYGQLYQKTQSQTAKHNLQKRFAKGLGTIECVKTFHPWIGSAAASFLPLDQTNCEEEGLAENLTRFSGDMDSGFGVCDSFGTT